MSTPKLVRPAAGHGSQQVAGGWQPAQCGGRGSGRPCGAPVCKRIRAQIGWRGERIRVRWATNRLPSKLCVMHKKQQAAAGEDREREPRTCARVQAGKGGRGVAKR